MTDRPSNSRQRKDTGTFAGYQRHSRRTWNRVVVDHAILYPTVGLTNEAGEVAGKVKKIFRDKGGVIGEEDRAALKSELGDMRVHIDLRNPSCPGYGFD